MTWARRNLFRTPLDALMSIVFGSVALFVLYRLFRFIFVTGRWEIVKVNEKLLLFGRYPDDELWRLSLASAILGLWAGFLAGLIAGRQVRAGTASWVGQTPRERALDLLERFWIPAAAILLLLAMSTTPGPWITAIATVITAVVGRLSGEWFGQQRLDRGPSVALGLFLGAVPVVTYLWVVGTVGYDDWGGFMLNAFLAICSIILCFPLGVSLALGRRSKLPLLRWLSTAYIEVLRGAPLFVLLLLASVALEFFVPASLAPSKATRAIVVFTLFTAAYMAEIVRGGLQSVPRGQEEAAKALGLSPVRQTFLIVLPQALRNVIPAQIGQLISLFKDTTLAGVAMGLFEMANVASAIPAQEEFRGQGLIGETLAITALLFWVGSYTMSRESQRLEKKLGVGTR
jgi:general L-amino acid transport system permease protein